MWGFTLNFNRFVKLNSGHKKGGTFKCQSQTFAEAHEISVLSCLISFYAPS